MYDEDKCSFCGADTVVIEQPDYVEYQCVKDCTNANPQPL